MNEHAALGGGEVALASLEARDLHLTRREKVDTSAGLVTDGHITLTGSDDKVLVVSEVGELSLVRSTDGKFHLGELGHNTEEAHLGLAHDSCPLDVRV